VVKNQKKSAKDILDEIFNSAKIFGNSSKWEDDATVIIIKREGVAKSLE
jgi:serine phosphatase RsbU (regulator of sigma subunit)